MVQKENHMLIEMKANSASNTPASPVSQHSNTCIRRISLIALTLQNTLSILLLRYVRTTPGPRFINSTAVVNSELQKTILSIFLVINEERSVIKGFKLILNKTIYQPYETFKTGIPALIYTLQNNLLFIAISNLDAATYQVTYQFKIFTTAILMGFILHRQLNLVRWFALFILFIGVCFVQLESMTATTSKQDVNSLYGLFAIITACILSGLAGVYFEKILKTTDASVWICNIQFGVFGMILGLITVYIFDGPEVKAKGFFFGYTTMAWIAIFVHSAGGLLVALVVKHADNILKGFATSAAIVLSCIVSILLFDFQLTLLFVLGSNLVIFSIFLYSKPEIILHVPILNIILKDRSILF